MSTPTQHTPGPWRWELNLKSKQLQLCGGRPMFDLTVMGFVRWGMNSAEPILLAPPDRGMRLLTSAREFASVVPGREHHADWFQTLDHPDARLIEAAPELLSGLNHLLYSTHMYTEDCSACAAAFAAAAKAEGR